MKKTLLFLFTLCFVTLKAQYQSQFFEGSFNSLPVAIQSGTNNTWQIGKPQKTLFSSASSTPNVIVTDTINYYPVNTISTFSFVALNYSQQYLSPYSIRWKQKLDMDAKKDGGIVEFSTNSGNTWQNAHNNPNVYQFYGFMPANKDTINGNQYCFSGRDTLWRDIWLCLGSSVANQNDSIFFRFTFKSDSINTNKEGWMIDNIFASKTIFHPVKEISQIDNIVVYPNMTSGIVNVEMKKKIETDAIQNIELYNNEGELIESYGPNYTKVVLDISNHPEGLYYLHVTINKRVSKFKLVYAKS